MGRVHNHLYHTQVLTDSLMIICRAYRARYYAPSRILIRRQLELKRQVERREREAQQRQAAAKRIQVRGPGHTSCCLAWLTHKHATANTFTLPCIVRCG
jgi:hypothetical protein